MALRDAEPAREPMLDGDHAKQPAGDDADRGREGREALPDPRRDQPLDRRRVAQLARGCLRFLAPLERPPTHPRVRLHVIHVEES